MSFDVLRSMPRGGRAICGLLTRRTVCHEVARKRADFPLLPPRARSARAIEAPMEARQRLGGPPRAVYRRLVHQRVSEAADLASRALGSRPRRDSQRPADAVGSMVAGLTPAPKTMAPPSRAIYGRAD